MSRTKRASVARETVEIVENGSYELAHGRKVEIAREIQESIAGTQLFRPEEFDSLVIPPAKTTATQFDVQNETTLSAAMRLIVGRKGEHHALGLGGHGRTGLRRSFCGIFYGGTTAGDQCCQGAKRHCLIIIHSNTSVSA